MKWMPCSGPMPAILATAGSKWPCDPQPFFTLEACANGGQCALARAAAQPSLVVLLGNFRPYFDICL